MRAMLLFIISILILAGCNNTSDPEVEKGTTTPSNGELTNEEVKEPGEKKETPVGEEENKNATSDLTKFFKPDKSTAYFLGEGNEYATYTEKTTWLSDQFVGTIVDNGGVTVMNIYKIGDDRIEKIMFEPIDEGATFPEIEELESMEPIETILATPIKVGTTFGKWTIVETGTTLETPYKTFENVFVIEEVGEDYVNRKYFVENFGDIKTEFIMETDQEEEFIVTSTLESIETQ